MAVNPDTMHKLSGLSEEHKEVYRRKEYCIWKLV